MCSGHRFQIDPIGFDAGDVNVYRELQNNPIDNVDPSGLRGYVRYLKITGEKKEPQRVSGFDYEFRIRIKGEHLKELEITQYISTYTQIWNGQGKLFTKEEIYKLYKEHGARWSHPSKKPFANNVQDQGWGDGQNWRQFNDDTDETIEDEHKYEVPFEPGGNGQYYPFRQTRRMTLMIRDKCHPGLIGEPYGKHVWGFTWQNFSGAPPATDRKAAGFYNVIGIDKIHDDKGFTWSWDTF